MHLLDRRMVERPKDMQMCFTLCEAWHVWGLAMTYLNHLSLILFVFYREIQKTHSSIKNANFLI